MEAVNRKVTYRLYPNKTQLKLLAIMLASHQWLYNNALEQRIVVFKQRNRSLSFADQCRYLTALRAASEEYGALNAQSLQVTLKRLDLAFKHFFRRVERCETPGFPRFKSLERFSGWGYKAHGDGWKLITDEGKTRLRISGVGSIKLRGKARNVGVPKTMELQHKEGRWYASVTFSCTPLRAHGTEAIGFDWGLESFLTFDDGQRVDNPRFLQRSKTKLRELQRSVSRKKRGSRSRNRAAARLAREHERVANRRRDFLHQESSKLVGRASLLATEKLSVKNMTRSARGTVDRPGKQVRQKAGLNRGILDGAP